MIKGLIKSDKKLVARFVVSLLLCIVLTITFFGVYAMAETADAAEETSETVETGLQAGDYLDGSLNIGDEPGSSVIQELIGVDASQPLEVILLLTLIALLTALGLGTGPAISRPTLATE